MLLGAIARPEVEIRSLLNKPVHPFVMTDLGGTKISSKQLLGKVVVLDFWGTWCTSCVRISPVMEALHQKYGKRGLVVIGADTFEHRGIKAAKQYVHHHHYTYRFTVNNDKILGDLGFEGCPLMVVIDKQGLVRQIYQGDRKTLKSDLEKVIRPLL
jgi:thiol-disulfide isomerase/thioredoxin